MQMQQDLCKLVQRALTTTCVSREASRAGRADAVSGPSADQAFLLFNMHLCSLECISHYHFKQKYTQTISLELPPPKSNPAPMQQDCTVVEILEF